MARGGSINGPEAGLDLETIRETLALIHEDLRRRPDLVAVRKALISAIELISAAEADAKAPAWGAGDADTKSAGNVVHLPTIRPRFVRWTPTG